MIEGQVIFNHQQVEAESYGLLRMLLLSSEYASQAFLPFESLVTTSTSFLCKFEVYITPRKETITQSTRGGANLWAWF